MALAGALAGGVIGWILAFVGLGPWGLVLGLAVTAVVVRVLAVRANGRPRVSLLAAYAFAFVLLTWPPLWLLVGFVRYAITGQSLGG